MDAPSSSEPIDKALAPIPESNDPVIEDGRFSLVINNNSFPAPAEEKETSTVPFSRIESLYHYADGLTRGKSLRQYGYGAMQSAPVDPTAIRVDSGYTLGPGDQVIVQASGSVELDSNLEIDRDGKIFLSEIGAISVAGKTLEQVFEVVSSAISQEYKDLISMFQWETCIPFG